MNHHINTVLRRIERRKKKYKYLSHDSPEYGLFCNYDSHWRLFKFPHYTHPHDEYYYSGLTFIKLTPRIYAHFGQPYML